MEFPGQKHLFSWMLFDFGHNYVNRNNDAIAEELCRCYTGGGGVIDASSTSAPAFCPAYGLAGTFFIGKNDTAFKLDVGFGTFNLLAVKTGFSMFNIFIRFFTEIALETDWAAFY